MKKFILNLNFLFIALIIINIIFGQLTLADEIEEGDLEGQIYTNLSQTGVKAGYGVVVGETANTVAEKIGKMISYALSFVGVIFLVLIIYAGFQWMTAGGNEETITKAKKRITQAAIGVAVIFAAYVITYFITEVIMTQTNYGLT